MKVKMGLFDKVSEGQANFEAGTYVATLLNIEPFVHQEYGDSLTWKFALSPDLSEPDDFVVNSDGETVSELWQITSTKMSPKAKPRIWCESLLNRKLELEEDLTLGELVDKRMTVQLTVNPPNKDGKVFNKVAGATPYTGAPKPIQTRKRKVVEVEDDGVETNFLPF